MAKELDVVCEGMRIYGTVQFPEGEGPFPVVVFSHGFGAARSYDSTMSNPFVERGIAFAAFDFRGGRPASQSDGAMLQMSALTEAADLDAVIDAVRALDQVDAARVFLAGSSQGGYVSSYVAAQRPSDVRGLVLFFPAFCIGDDVREMVAEASDTGEIPETATRNGLTIGRRYLQDALAVDIFEVIKGYTGDVLIVHGADDAVVPAEYALRAARTYGATAEVVILGAMKHGFSNSLPEHGKRAIDLALDFIADHL